jgi:hypothetical protein
MFIFLMCEYSIKYIDLSLHIIKFIWLAEFDKFLKFF